MSCPDHITRVREGRRIHAVNVTNHEQELANAQWREKQATQRRIEAERALAFAQSELANYNQRHPEE